MSGASGLGNVSPPLNDPPVGASGQFSQAWAAHLQDISDAVNGLGAGVVDGSNATAGSVGEVMAAAVASAAAVAMGSGAAITVAQLALTPGDWDVSGTIGFAPAPTTSFRSAGGGLSLTAAQVLDFSSGAAAVIGYSAQVPAAAFGFPVGVLRVSISAAAAVYLSAVATFTVSTCKGYGFIRARRVR